MSAKRVSGSFLRYDPAMASRPETPQAPRQPGPVPKHLSDWRLPPNWIWGLDSVEDEHRHFQEVIDALGRSLSLVTAPNPEHAAWLEAEARHLAHRNHPSIPTTYHYWTNGREPRRGPGYLRRWITGETIASRVSRQGPEDLPYALQVVRDIGSTLAYLHDTGIAHGAVSADTIWVTPTGRTWMLGWQWTMPSSDVPDGLSPSRARHPIPPEWGARGWAPTPASDQWQIAAVAFAALTGERPPSINVPPIRLVQPECPQSVASVLERALSARPEDRFPSVAAMLRALDRGVATRTVMVLSDEPRAKLQESEEARLRWAVGDDYEVLAALGAGTFGSVWRVRDLTLGREVALKMLHPHVALDDRAVGRFRREARLAAQLAHPAIVPIYDWDSHGDVAWYTMELAESGSVGDLIARSGARPLAEVSPQIAPLLDGLATAHAHGIIHRDLKPENILIDRYRRWRITDFGIANVTGEDAAGTTGTPAFASPEQLLGEPQGLQADCFSFAAILVFALTGTLPFGSGDAKSILGRQLAQLADLSTFEPHLAGWLRKALAPSPEDRFPDAAAMLDAWLSAEAPRAVETAWWRRWI